MYNKTPTNVPCTTIASKSRMLEDKGYIGIKIYLLVFSMIHRALLRLRGSRRADRLDQVWLHEIMNIEPLNIALIKQAKTIWQRIEEHLNKDIRDQIQIDENRIRMRRNFSSSKIKLNNYHYTYKKHCINRSVYLKNLNTFINSPGAIKKIQPPGKI